MGWSFWAQGVRGKRHGASPEDSSVGLELGEPRMHESPLTEVFHHGYGMAMRTPHCLPCSSVSQTK